MMFKPIEFYKEFRMKTDKSVVNHISDEPIPQKDAVLEYLKSFPNDGIRCSTLRDFVTGDLLTPTVWVHNDGEYLWTDEEIYHFEKYNMVLNSDFLSKVLKTA